MLDVVGMGLNHQLYTLKFDPFVNIFEWIYTVAQQAFVAFKKTDKSAWSWLKKNNTSEEVSAFSRLHFYITNLCDYVWQLCLWVRIIRSTQKAKQY